MNELIAPDPLPSPVERHITFLENWASRLDQLRRSALPIDRPTALRMVEDLDRLLAPCTPQQAAACTRMLLGNYPVVNAHDPDAYVLGLTAEFATMPLFCARTVIDTVCRSTKFCPTRHDVASAIESATRRYRLARMAARYILGLHDGQFIWHKN